MKERSNLGGRIAHGALIVGFMSTASTFSIAHVIHREGLSDFPVSAGYDKMRFLKPVKLGDTVTVHYTVAEVDKERGRSMAKAGGDEPARRDGGGRPAHHALGARSCTSAS